jgi:hypothetical protein
LYFSQIDFDAGDDDDDIVVVSEFSSVLEQLEN